MGHETLWFPKNIGKAAPPRHRAASARAEFERGCAPSAGIGRIGVAVAAGMGERRRGGLGRQAGSWSAAQADGPTMPAIAAPFAERGQGVWLSQRAMDVEAHGHGDMAGIAGALSPFACVEGSCQVPERRAIQRNEQAIAHWKRYKWPAIKKSPTTWRPSRVPRRERLSTHPHASSDLGA
jgi:hypothetical protein